jgi:hypothetical protein
MVGSNKKLGGAVSYPGSSSMTMKSALIISSMLIISIMWASSSALAAESKDDVGVSSSSFNKRRWTNSNVVEEDDAAADGAGKRVLVSRDRHSILSLEFSGQFSFLATIPECLSIRILTRIVLCRAITCLLILSGLLLIHHYTVHTASSASRIKARRQFVAGISGSGS